MWIYPFWTGPLWQFNKFFSCCAVHNLFFCSVLKKKADKEVAFSALLFSFETIKKGYGCIRCERIYVDFSYSVGLWIYVWVCSACPSRFLNISAVIGCEGTEIPTLNCSSDCHWSLYPCDGPGIVWVNEGWTDTHRHTRHTLSFLGCGSVCVWIIGWKSIQRDHPAVPVALAAMVNNEVHKHERQGDDHRDLSFALRGDQLRHRSSRTLNKQ